MCIIYKDRRVEVSKPESLLYFLDQSDLDGAINSTLNDTRSAGSSLASDDQCSTEMRMNGSIQAVSTCNLQAPASTIINKLQGCLDTKTVATCKIKHLQ